MEIFFGWIIFSFVIGFIGTGRKIGFFAAFALSLLLSPIIGLIITLVSPLKTESNIKKIYVKDDNSPYVITEIIDNENISNEENIPEDDIIKKLERLSALREKGAITEDEFNNLKKKYV